MKQKIKMQFIAFMFYSVQVDDQYLSQNMYSFVITAFT